MKKLRIMTVCGFGLGSSMILKITLDGILKENNIQAETFCADSTTAVGESFDVVFTSRDMSQLFKNVKTPVVVIDNFLSKDEIRAKGLEVVQKAAAES
ncbi:MAG: PTS sugar transporter subunit IIB [Anaerolineaceae bacterium]|jgi:PTS system ascorbate-specific IIB component